MGSFFANLAKLIFHAENLASRCSSCRFLDLTTLTTWSSLSLSFSVVFEWLRFDQSSIGDVLLNVSERNFIVASLYYYF